MKKVRFVVYADVEEEVEFDDNLSEKEIDDEFEKWIDDNLECYWEEIIEWYKKRIWLQHFQKKFYKIQK